MKKIKMNQDTNKVFNPLKGISPYGWHFEQEIYLRKGISRAIKAGGGSGNIPKILFTEYYTVEDGKDNCIDIAPDKNTAIGLCNETESAKEVFRFIDGELVGCVYKK